MPIFEYGGIFLGLVAMFHVPTDTVQTELAWSPDTVHWERVDPGSPVIARGPAGSPDSGCIYASIPVFEKNEIRIYYGGSNGPHTGWRDGFFCVAKLQPDRFAGFAPASTDAPGTVVTRPIEVTSADLRINANADSGQVRVGVIGGDPSLEQALPIQADRRDGVCHWKTGSLRSLVGKKVQLAFEIRSARVFSFRFA